MRIYDDGERRFRARTGPLPIPEELAPWTLAVLGLDERPVVRRRRLTAAAAPGDGKGLWPAEVATVEDWEQGSTRPDSASASSRWAEDISQAILRLRITTAGPFRQLWIAR